MVKVSTSWPLAACRAVAAGAVWELVTVAGMDMALTLSVAMTNRKFWPARCAVLGDGGRRKPGGSGYCGLTRFLRSPGSVRNMRAASETAIILSQRSAAPATEIAG